METRNAEKVRVYNRKRRVTEKDREAKGAENRRYRAAHSDAVNAYNMAYYRRKISIIQVRTSPEEVYRRAMAALPSGLPRFIRDDVVSSLCLAILEGEINVNDMAAQARVFLRTLVRVLLGRPFVEELIGGLAGAGDVLALAPPGLDLYLFVERLVLKRTHTQHPKTAPRLDATAPGRLRASGAATKTPRSKSQPRGNRALSVGP